MVGEGGGARAAEMLLKRRAYKKRLRQSRGDVGRGDVSRIT